jgi:tRNA threonylcarbamoyladenosine biosynthesis protein TsaE
MEGRRLVGELLDEIGGADDRVAGNVVDRFLGIERHALAAQHVERVHHMAAHPQHAAFEDGEKPDRAGADDRHIAAMTFACHPCVPRRCRRGYHGGGGLPVQGCGSGCGRPPERNKTRPVSRATAFDIDLPDEAATAGLAGRLAQRAQRGDVIGLAGELGSGKTTFARAFIRALGRGDEDVPSPTFTLVEVYGFPGQPPVWHFDLYRLTAPEQAYELGIEDAWSDGISLIEWPERLGPLLPAEHLLLQLVPKPEAQARAARLSASPAWIPRLEGVPHG